MIPAELESRRGLGSEWGGWLDRLPRLVAELTDEWALRPDGDPRHGYCSLVLPMLTRDGDRVALKVALPDDESAHEHLALRAWSGRGAVRLLRADPGRRALLLERLQITDLSDHWDEEACQIVAGLYGALHRPPLPQLVDQAGVVARWLEALAADAGSLPMPRRLIEQTLAVGRALVGQPATAVLHGDLHFGNVLLGTRDGEDAWLAIDPKPANGDPAYEIEPMLRNRFAEYGQVGTVRDAIRRRFHTLIDAAGFDEDRARDWVIVRSVVNAHWAHQDAARAQRALSPSERDHVTRCITVAKAVQE